MGGGRGAAGGGGDFWGGHEWDGEEVGGGRVEPGESDPDISLLLKTRPLITGLGSSVRLSVATPGGGEMDCEGGGHPGAPAPRTGRGIRFTEEAAEDFEEVSDRCEGTQAGALKAGWPLGSSPLLTVVMTITAV